MRAKVTVHLDSGPDGGQCVDVELESDYLYDIAPDKVREIASAATEKALCAWVAK